MERPGSSLYDVLGVPRDAKLQDITRAYNRYRSQMRNETVAPDPRRDALMQKAFEVLSDPYRREAYDASLRRGFTERIPPEKRRPVALASLAVILASLGIAGGFFATRKPAGPPPKPVDEIRAAAILALGRVEILDMAGAAKVAGVAVAIEEGVAATPCAGIPPNAQLRVVASPRRAPAVVAESDPQGRCRLAVSAGAGFPLPINPTAPKPGDRVYAPLVSAAGEVTLRTGRISRVQPSGDVRLVSVDLAGEKVVGGSPLIDADGRLLAIAWADGDAVFSSLPERWLDRASPIPAKKQPPAETAVEDGTATRSPSDEKVSPERRDALEKAFRPPSKVPDDL
jgi:hypothetical protein